MIWPNGRPRRYQKLQEVVKKRAADIELFREKAQIQLKSIKSEMARARIDEEQEENRVMAMDLTGMDEMRLSYFHRKIFEIVERQANRHTAALAAEEAAKVAEAENVANAAASEIARNLEDAFVSVQE